MPKSKKKMDLEALARMTQQGFADLKKDMDVRFNAVDVRFDTVDARLAVLEMDMKEVKVRLDKIEENIANLTATLDTFLKRLMDHEQEFELLKQEMKLVKKVLKEKLHIDIETR